MKLDPRHLVQLATIVEAGSYHAAAALLGVSQPAVSRNIKTLEARLGAQVFDRSERKIKPTELGRRLARHGMVIKAAEAAAGTYADKVFTGEAGNVQVGAPPTLASYLISGILGRFLTASPDVKAILRVGLVHELRSLLIQGRVDVVIGPIGLAEHAEELVANTLIDDRIGILCRAGHPLTQVRQITPEALEEQRWAVHSRGSLLRFQTDNALAAFGMRELNIAIETDSVDVAFEIARWSNIVTTMPKLPSQPQLARGDLNFLAIDNPRFSRPIGCIQRRSHEPSRAEDTFLQFLRKELLRASSLSTHSTINDI